MVSGVAELLETQQRELRDLISGRSLDVGFDGATSLAPYETLWITEESTL
jgi:hypothetical protein